MIENILQAIRELHEDKEQMIKIAVNMNTAGIDVKYNNWFTCHLLRKPAGVIISEFSFLKSYISANIKECYLKARLTDISIGEEWGTNIF